MRCGLDFAVRHRLLAIGDLGGTTVAMIDHDDPLDVVQLLSRKYLSEIYTTEATGRRAQSPYCAIPATGRPTPSTEACLRNGAIKRLRPTKPAPPRSVAAPRSAPGSRRGAFRSDRICAVRR